MASLCVSDNAFSGAIGDTLRQGSSGGNGVRCDHIRIFTPPVTPAGLLTTRREQRLRPASAVVPRPAPAPATHAKLGPSADQNNLANRAQRLEAVMRRPNRKELEAV